MLFYLATFILNHFCHNYYCVPLQHQAAQPWDPSFIKHHNLYQIYSAHMKRTEYEKLTKIFNGELPEPTDTYYYPTLEFIYEKPICLAKRALLMAEYSEPTRHATRAVSTTSSMQPEIVKHIPHIFKQHTQNYNALILQHKKISTICSRELRRGLSRTSKINPFLKNKRINKELQKYLARHQREQREAKKKEEAEREVQRKIDEQEKEELRQRRKFNYLMSQTEAFASFFLNRQKTVGTEQSAATTAAEQQLAHLREFDGEKTRSTEEYEHRFVLQPEMITTKLRAYQLKGLNWLVNLYNQGINGILADDMGLGKTVQVISLLAWLAESENIWGPFIVVTPASTLHNWENELSRFLPRFRTVLYYGTLAERAELRKAFKTANVVVTSYQVAVSDENILKKIKWQYMILDEAQAIKSITSQRWSTLLSYKARNRCLLTGTPIQNNMQELWSLLHFIMPTLFDSLSEFKDWFLTENQVDENQISKLHTILKPFMLRRHKEDIKDELGTKEIIHIYCDMSLRQRILYDSLRSKICVVKRSGADYDNVLMQLKKVCNHPSLFEQLKVQTAFSLTPGSATIAESCGAIIRYVPPTAIITTEEEFPKFRLLEERRMRSHLELRAFTEQHRPARCALYVDLERRRGERIDLLKQYEFIAESVKRQKIESNIETERKLYFLERDDLSGQYYTKRDRDSCEYMDRLCKVPPLNTLISDSGKLRAIDELLRELQSGDHRVLIYFQMTKMMDLFEEYLVKRGFSYIRLDGSVRVNTRKELVGRWQAGEVFIFILSTRAGGVGINLTAADTVIFYDSDWNPTVDQQAMDRAHRLGQKKPVTVYRLITRDSIEEKIIERANEKDEMQRIIIKGQIFSH